MRRARRPTLGQAFAASMVVTAVVVAVALVSFHRKSRSAILSASERLRRDAAHRIEKRVAGSLGRAQSALENVELAIRSGAVPVPDVRAIEAELFLELIAGPQLAEVTFTHAHLDGYDEDGDAQLGREDRFQVSVYRKSDGGVATRLTSRNSGGFEARTRDHGSGRSFKAVQWRAIGPARDPTKHPTFSVLAARSNRGRAIWSDLHYSELDQSRRDRRVVLSVQKPVTDPQGRFAGVVRAAIVTDELDSIVRGGIVDGPEPDPHRIALMAVPAFDAGRARLVARVTPRDRIVALPNELRIDTDRPPPEIGALLASPLVRGLSRDNPAAEGAVYVGENRYLATLQGLSLADGGTKGWFVAIVVPEDYYTRDLAAAERRFLNVFLITVVVLIVIGGATLWTIRRGLQSATKTTAEMRRFDFGVGTQRSFFRDIDEVILGLERAKTVARAMGRYIPLDLVRRLYERNEEPRLGGELREVSLLFTDMEGFTALSERLEPDELSRRLGEYLEALTTAIEATDGTIDKYIGDAVMAFWNAPVATPRHAERACHAVLACQKALGQVHTSPAWSGLPPTVTRFGLHLDRVMVGHFGAKTRLSYTALGDGVNLAARLEPLCKQYGVSVLASEAIVREAGDAFAFRLIDRVAVKGKSRAVAVYELLGLRSELSEVGSKVRAYEAAFTAYQQRNFDLAAALLDPHLEDPPSAVLRKRCLMLAAHPPHPDWDGVYVAPSK